MNWHICRYEELDLDFTLSPLHYSSIMGGNVLYFFLLPNIFGRRFCVWVDGVTFVCSGRQFFFPAHKAGFCLFSKRG